jgi:hypothetical protein
MIIFCISVIVVFLPYIFLQIKKEDELLLISKNKFDDDFQEYLIRRDQKK